MAVIHSACYSYFIFIIKNKVIVFKINCFDDNIPGIINLGNYFFIDLFFNNSCLLRFAENNSGSGIVKCNFF